MDIEAFSSPDPALKLSLSADHPAQRVDGVVQAQ